MIWLTASGPALRIRWDLASSLGSQAKHRQEMDKPRSLRAAEVVDQRWKDVLVKEGKIVVHQSFEFLYEVLARNEAQKSVAVVATEEAVVDIARPFPMLRPNPCHLRLQQR